MDFLVATGISNETIFCSSLPGNDVNEKISPEIKQKLQEAAIIILILSDDYYKSAYCLNEAGVAWYFGDVVKSIPFGLPEINHESMVGFLNSDYKLRRLDNLDDISFLYDIAAEELKCKSVKLGVINRETQKLMDRYSAYVSGRKVSEEPPTNQPLTDQISSDACLLLMYASTDPAGQIIHLKSLSGDSISTAGFGFILNDSVKETARWKGAVEELEQYGFIRAVSLKREVFELTREGFDAAEKLKRIIPHVDQAYTKSHRTLEQIVAYMESSSEEEEWI